MSTHTAVSPDFAIARALALQVRMLSVGQIARRWFHRRSDPEIAAAKVIGLLQKSGLIERRVVEAHPLLRLMRPLFCWNPGQPHPSRQQFDELAKASSQRWTKPHVPVEVFTTTKVAAHLFGAFSDAHRAKHCEATHDLHLSEVFVRYRPNTAEHAAWWGEAALPKLGFEIKGMKDPDAFLLDALGQIRRVVEFAGIYTAEHLTKFHSHCAGQAAERLSRRMVLQNARTLASVSKGRDKLRTMVKTLSSDEDAILNHVARYRLTLPKLLANSGIVESNSEAALENLVTAGWLEKSALCPGHTDQLYYHLSPSAARHLGKDAEFGQPLSRELRIDSFAVAVYCSGDPSRRLLTKEEFKDKFHRLWFPRQPVRYCLERAEGSPTRLSFLKVDRDGAGRWDRLIDSCARFLRQRTDTDRIAAEHRPKANAFAELVEKGQFQFSVLTALTEKKRAIELELERRSAAGESAPPMQVHVVPGLFRLLFPELASSKEAEPRSKKDQKKRRGERVNSHRAPTTVTISAPAQNQENLPCPTPQHGVGHEPLALKRAYEPVPKFDVLC